MQALIGQRVVDSIKPANKAFEIRDTKLKGFLLRVQPSGVKTYICQYGRGKRITIGSAELLSPAFARNRAMELLGQVAKGDDPQAAKRSARKAEAMPTLRGYIEGDYSEWAKTHRKTGAQTVARVLAAFGADMGDTRLDKITAWNLEKWRAKRLKSGRQHATLNRDFSALQGALTKAVEWGVLTVNPLTGIKALAVDDSPNVRYLDKPEEKRLRDALDAREERLRAERDTGNAWRRARDVAEMRDLRMVAYADHVNPMVLVSMHTGLRRGELFQLTWQNVNLDTALLTVMGKTAKKLKTRYIPLNREALDVLRGWKEQQDAPDGLVFPGREGKPFTHAKKAWAGVLRAASVTKFRWHDLRHHFASRLVMAGVDLNTVRELLGHSDIKMTLRYAHLAPEHKAAAVARLVEVA